MNFSLKQHSQSPHTYYVQIPQIGIYTWALTGTSPSPYPPFDCIWLWIEFTELTPLHRSPDPTWAVWTKFVGSPIMLRSICRRRFGCGCSAMQQLKQNQNSLMLNGPYVSIPAQDGRRGYKRQQKWTRDVRLGGGRTQVSHVWGVRDRIKNSQANPGPGRRPPQ